MRGWTLALALACTAGLPVAYIGCGDDTDGDTTTGGRADRDEG
jgi:hypothetical protein